MRVNIKYIKFTDGISSLKIDRTFNNTASVEETSVFVSAASNCRENRERIKKNEAE